jgi:hypothetical protein
VAKKLNKEQAASFARQLAEREGGQDSVPDRFWRELIARRDRPLFMTPELRSKFEQKRRIPS